MRNLRLLPSTTLLAGFVFAFLTACSASKPTSATSESSEADARATIANRLVFVNSVQNTLAQVSLTIEKVDSDLQTLLRTWQKRDHSPIADVPPLAIHELAVVLKKLSGNLPVEQSDGTWKIAKPVFLAVAGNDSVCFDVSAELRVTKNSDVDLKTARAELWVTPCSRTDAVRIATFETDRKGAITGHFSTERLALIGAQSSATEDCRFGFDGKTPQIDCEPFRTIIGNAESPVILSFRELLLAGDALRVTVDALNLKAAEPTEKLLGTGTIVRDGSERSAHFSYTPMQDSDLIPIVSISDDGVPTVSLPNAPGSVSTPLPISVPGLPVPAPAAPAPDLPGTSP